MILIIFLHRLCLPFATVILILTAILISCGLRDTNCFLIFIFMTPFCRPCSFVLNVIILLSYIIHKQRSCFRKYWIFPHLSVMISVCENSLVSFIEWLKAAYHYLVFLFFYFTVYHIKEDGWTKISEQDCKELHYKYAQEKASLS